MKKILLVRVGRIGDMVMITAAMKVLFEAYPDAEFHIVTSNDGKRALNNYSKRLTQFYIYDRKGIFSFLRKTKLASLIGRQKYSDIFCFELGDGFFKLFTRSSASVHRIENYTNTKNYAWHCLKMVNRATGTNKQEWINLRVDNTSKQLSHNILAEAGIADDDIVIGLHPSFSGLRKTSIRSKTSRHERGWPVEHWAELARRLHEHAQQQGKPVQVMMDLLEEDRELGEQINALAGDCIKVLIPPLNFERYKATLQRMNLFITPNTGPMHIAGAVGTRMVALFAVESPSNSGPYVPDTQYTPLCAEDMAEPDKGLAAISVDAVYEACLKYF